MIVVGLQAVVVVALKAEENAAEANGTEDSEFEPYVVADEAYSIEPEDPTFEPYVVGIDAYRDPLEPLNRVFFRFNDVSARYVLVPLAQGYNDLLPQPARTGVGNFFNNIKMPVRGVNHLLQGRPRMALQSVYRFGINTTVGILGVFDPAADRFGLPMQPTNFEGTLAHYGAGYGIYLELPFFGPSDLRNGTGRLVDAFLNPIPYLTEYPETLVIQSFDFFQDFAVYADSYESLRAETEDPYEFFRNLHIQTAERDATYEYRDVE